MSDDWKTLRVPKERYEAAKEQKEEHGRTWGEQIVRPDDESDGDDAPLPADVREQLDRIEHAANTVEDRSGRIERTLEDMGAGR